MSTDTAPIKPCPFCGEVPVICKDLVGDFYAMCRKVNCQGTNIMRPFQTMEAFTVSWNGRPLEDALQGFYNRAMEQVAAFDALNKECIEQVANVEAENTRLRGIIAAMKMAASKTVEVMQ